VLPTPVRVTGGEGRSENELAALQVLPQLGAGDVTQILPTTTLAGANKNKLAADTDTIAAELTAAQAEFATASSVSVDQLRAVAPTFVSRVESDSQFADRVTKVARTKTSQTAARVIAQIMGDEDLERVDGDTTVTYIGNTSGRGIEVSKATGKINQFITGARTIQMAEAQGNVIIETPEFSTNAINNAVSKIALKQGERANVRAITFVDAPTLGGNAYALTDAGKTLVINRQLMPKLGASEVEVEVSRAPPVETRQELGLTERFSPVIQDGYQVAQMELAKQFKGHDLRGSESTQLVSAGADAGKLSKGLGVVAYSAVLSGLSLLGDVQGSVDVPTSILSPAAVEYTLSQTDSDSNDTVDMRTAAGIDVNSIGNALLDLDSATKKAPADATADMFSSKDYQTYVPDSVAFMDAMMIDFTSQGMLAADQQRVVSKLAHVEYKFDRKSVPAPGGGKPGAGGGDDPDAIDELALAETGAVGRRDVRGLRPTLDLAARGMSRAENVKPEIPGDKFERKGLAGTESIRRIEEGMTRDRGMGEIPGKITATTNITSQSILQPATLNPGISTTTIMPMKTFVNPMVVMTLGSAVGTSAGADGAAANQPVAVALNTSVNKGFVSATGSSSLTGMLPSSANNDRVLNSNVGMRVVTTNLSTGAFDFPSSTFEDNAGESPKLSTSTGNIAITPFEMPSIGDRAVLSATVTDQKAIAVAKLGLASDTQMYNALWSRVENPQNILPIIRDIRRAKQQAIEDPSNNAFTSLAALSQSSLEGVREFARLIENDPNLAIDLDNAISLNQPRDVRAAVTPTVKRMGKERITALRAKSTSTDKQQAQEARGDEASVRLGVASKLQIRQAFLESANIEPEIVPLVVEDIISIRASNENNASLGAFA
ncbi:MAG: hypothetical protein K8I00_11390, partial [Candidatus Omnitrophica bacterium]|nr:hypothetical protein [Candidatus Omnitrophota bacterium]